MRPPRAVSILVALLPLAIALTVVAPSASARRTVVFPGKCVEPEQRPRLVVIACGDGNLYLDHLRWSGWGGTSATASGIGHANDCDPYCARGHFHAHRVSVTATRLRHCWNGQWHYTRLRYRWQAGAFSDGSLAFSCPRPRLDALHVRLTGHRPGPHYYVVVSVRTRLCGMRGVSVLAIRERLRLGGRTFARRDRSFAFRQTRRCREMSVHWRLGDPFFGIGRYEIRAVGRDDAGTKSRPRYWHQVTTD